MFRFCSATLLVLVAVVNGFSATRYSTKSNGNWSSTSTWSDSPGSTVGGASVPTAGDAVVITSGDNVRLDVANATCASVFLEHNAALRFNASTQLTVSEDFTLGASTSAGTLDMTFGGTLVCASITDGNASSSFLAGSGTVQITGTTTLPATSAFSAFNRLSIAGGTVSLARNTSILSTLNLIGGNFIATNYVSMASGSTISRSGGTMTGTLQGTLQGTSQYNVEYTGNSKTTGDELSGTDLRNVSVQMTAGQVLGLNQSRSLVGNINISSGIFDLGTFTLNRTSIGGSLTVSGTLRLGGNAGGESGSNFPANFSTFNFSNGTLEYNGSNDIIQTVFDGPAYHHLVLTNGAGIGIAQKRSVANITVNSGSFTVNSNVVFVPDPLNHIGGTGTLVGTGTVRATRVSPTADFSTQYSLTKNVATLTVDYAGNGAQNINAFTYGGLVTSGSGTKTLIGSVTVNNSCSIGVGTTFDQSTRTMTIAGGGTLEVQGRLEFTSSSGLIRSGTSGTSTLVMGSSGYIRTIDALGLGPVANASLVAQLGGAWSTASIASNGTVEYASTNAQTVTDMDYNHLVISNSGTKTWTLGGTRNVTGNVTIGGTLALSGNQAVNLKGNWTNNGTFRQGTAMLTFNNSLADQHLFGDSTTSFQNLTVQKASGKKLILAGQKDITVNGTLAIVLGSLHTNTKTLKLGNTAILTEAAGQTVVGNLNTSRMVNINSTNNFGGVGLEITPTGAAPGATTVYRVTGTPISNNSTSSIKRYFTIVPSQNTGLNCSLKFSYDSVSELNGQNASELGLYQSASPFTTWTDQGGVVERNTLTLSGLTQLGRLTASDIAHQIGQPTLDSIPSAFCAGATAILKGTNLRNATAVGIGTSEVEIVSANTRSITIKASVATLGNILVTTPGGVVQSHLPTRVEPANVGGIVSGGGVFCSGNDSATLILSGHVGKVQKWQYASDTNFTTGFVELLDTNSSLGVSNLTSTKYYRAIVAQGQCPMAISKTDSMVVKAYSETARVWTGRIDHDWNKAGNWMCGSLPSATTDVGIPSLANVSITSSAWVKNILIEAEADLSLGANTLNVYGNWTNLGNFNPNLGTVAFEGSANAVIVKKRENETFFNLTIDKGAGKLTTGSTSILPRGTLLVKSGTLDVPLGKVMFLQSAAPTSFVDNTSRLGRVGGTITANSTFLVSRYIASPASRLPYLYPGRPAPTVLLAPSLKGLVLMQWSDDILVKLGATVAAYNEKNSVGDRDSTKRNSAWRYLGSYTLSLPIARGYKVNVGLDNNDDLLTVMGKPQVGDVTVPISYSENGTKGWNLIGNPYPCEIDWDSVYFHGTNSEVVEANLYVMDPFNSSQSNSTYFIHNALTGINLDPRPGSGNRNNNAAGCFIASSQGFFVRAISNGNLTFCEKHKPANPPSEVYANLRTESPNRLIKFDVSDGKNSSQAILAFHELGKDVYDARDAEQFSTGELLLYTSMADRKLSLNTLVWPSKINLNVPLVVETNVIGKKKLTISEMTVSEMPYYLHDKYSDEYIPLFEGQVYEFEISQNSTTRNLSRFSIVSTPIVTNLAEEATWSSKMDMTLSPNPYTNGKLQIAIRGSKAERLNIELHDAAGTKVYQKMGLATTINPTGVSLDLHLGNLPSGIYTLKCASETAIYTQRLIVFR